MRLTLVLASAFVVVVLACSWQSFAETKSADEKNKSAKDTPTRRLLDKLAQQNSGQELFKDEWLATLKEIVDLGPAAVPELIEELDATDDNMMLRSLGFTLRAIGDKRAVPALIRAIPKTLVEPGSDMGLRTDDPELLKFAQANELRPNSRENEYGFGRPVREICGALQKLTGVKHGEEELYHIFLHGVASQKRMKRELFHRMARKWADWWEKNWADHVKDKAYAKVNLPKLATDEDAPSPFEGLHFKTTSGSSNWILESVLNPKAKRVFYDLDTGRVAALPEKWRQAQNIETQLGDITAWASREGFDLMGTEYVSPKDGRRIFALRSIGLLAWELGADRWKMQSNDVGLDTLQSEGKPVGELLLHYDETLDALDPETTASFLYVTRDGTPGLLFVGIEVQDDGLKPGGVWQEDNELRPVAFYKGRRFAFTYFEELDAP